MLWPPYCRRVLAEADEYLESFGEDSYRECRKDCVAALEARDWKRAKFLSYVRAELAKKLGRDRRLDTATRYLEEAQEPYDHGPGYVPHRPKDSTLH